MVKRIFAVIGVVLGTVVAFSGAVFGVLALMGKFKTPEVPPKNLMFEKSEMVVVSVGNNVADGSEIFSYKLIATNDEFDHPVNKPTCYVWFVDNVGSNLITLCDKNGNPLTVSNGKYKINCNELSYFKVQNNAEELWEEFDKSSSTNGKVVLQARSENERAQSNQMTIWIDREIESISLNANGNPESVVDNKQTVTIKTDNVLDIEYLVNPEIARNPISIENEKEIELYYCGASKQGFDYSDYVRVNAQSVASDPNLAKLFYYDNGKLKFKTNQEDTYSFKIAVFKTYESKEEYETDELRIDEKNYEKLTYTGMVVKDFSIKVVNASVSGVNMNSGGVVLNVYSQNDYISLNGVSGVDGAKDNDLEIVMWDTNIPAQETAIRYNEVLFGGDYLNYFVNEAPKFITETNQTPVSYDTITEGTHSYNDKDGKAIIVGDYKLLNKITTSGGEEYYCENGACFVKLDGDDKVVDIKLLSSGSYLNFFVLDTTKNAYVLLDNSECFEIKNSINSLGDKSWNVITKSELDLEATQSLQIGVMVVNDEGGFNVENFFDATSVQVKSTNLLHNIETKEFTLTSTFDADNEDFSNQPLAFNQIVEILAGTYNACVFVADITEEGALEKLNVEVLKDITFEINERIYCLVGYLDSEKQLVNTVRVKINENVTKDSSTDIYMIQLKNPYPYDVSGNIISTEQFITSLIVEDTELVAKDLTSYVIDEEVKTSNKVTIKPALNIEDVDFSVNFGSDAEDYNGGKSVYENSTEHKINITCNDVEILMQIAKFYDVKNADLLHTYVGSTNAQINPTSLTLNETEGEEAIIITYSAGDCLANINTPIYITFTCAGKILESSPIFIRSTAPENLVFKYKDSEEEIQSFRLAKTADEALTSNNYFAVNITWNDSTKTYNETGILYANGNLVEGKTFNLSSLLNSKITEEGLGFQDESWKGKELDVGYAGGDSNIIAVTGTAIDTVGCGETYLAVTVHDITWYVKVIVSAQNFVVKDNANGNALKDNYILTTQKTNLNLSELLSYYYDETKIDDLSLLTIKDALISGYNGEVSREETATGFKFIETATGNAILTIVKILNDWQIAKDNNYQFTSYSLRLTLVSKTLALKNITIQLNSSLNITKNVTDNAWTNGILYQNTTVRVYEAINTGDGEEFSWEPLIKISSTSDISPEIWYTYSVDGVIDSEAQKVEESGNLLLSNLGSYTFTVKVGSSEQKVLGFKVVPNVIVEWADETFENEEYEFDSVFTLKQINTTHIYGETKNPANYNKIAMYNSMNADGTAYLYREGFSGTEPVTISSNNTSTNIDNENKKITFGWIENIDATKTETLTIKVDGKTIETKELTITNRYSGAVKHSATENEGKYAYTLMAMTEINPLVSLDTTNFAELTNFELTSIKWGTAEILVDSKIKIGEIGQPYNNAQLVFTFVNNNGTEDDATDDKTLIYTTDENVSITIKPYILALDIKNAYSETNFDLLSHVFNTTNLATDENISKFWVDGIYATNEGEEPLNIVTGELSGYEKDSDNNGSIITFDKFYGDNLTVYVKYTITYNGGISYTFRQPITIQNKHTIAVSYPQKADEFDGALKVDANSFSFTDGEKDLFKNWNNGKTEVNFEPINIYANKTNEIDFTKLDRNLLFNRVGLGLAIGYTGGGTTPTIASIEKVGYSNFVGFANYYNNQITIDGTKVTFGTINDNGQRGYVVLKITTTSGNYAYYVVHVYHTADANSPLSKMIIHGDDIEGATIGDLMDKIDTTAFESAFGIKYSDVSGKLDAYILSATSINDGESFVYALNSRVYSAYAKDNGNLINANIIDYTSYTTLTLSLVYKNGVQIYPIGILEFVLQPEVNEVKDNATLTQDIDNGEYSYNLGNQKQEIAVGDLFTVSGATISSAEIVGGNIADIAEIATGETTLKIVGYVSEELNFAVKYTYAYDSDSNKTFVLIVNYTLKSLEIENKTFTATTGEFDETDGFVKTVKISEIFNGYKGGVEIEGLELDSNNTTDTDTTVSGVKYRYDNNDWILTFDQTANRQTIIINFTLTDIKENNLDVERTVVFTVQAGVSVSWSSGEGRYSTARLSSSGAIDYSSTTGSSISVVKSQPTGKPYYQYSVGGLKVYVAGETYSLTIDFDEKDVNRSVSYLVGLTGPTQTVSDTTTFNFVHLSAPRNMDLKITIGDTNINFFITAAQTYGGIEVVYDLIGASHERVVNNLDDAVVEIGNIYAHLFTDRITPAPISSIGGVGPDGLPIASTPITNSHRILVKDLTGGEIGNFDGIGFTTTNHPNFLRYTVTESAPMELSASGLKFTGSTSGAVALNITNKANEEDASSDKFSVNYNFVIANDNSTMDYGNENNADFVISDSNNAASKAINLTGFSSTGDLMLGTIRNNANNSFRITNIGMFIGATAATINTTKILQDGSYEFTLSDGWIINIYSVNDEVYCKLDVGTATGSFEELKINLTAYGANNAVLNNFNIMFFNYNIVEHYAVGQDSVYASTMIDMADKIETPADLTLQLITETANNSVFSFDTSSNILTIASIGDEYKYETLEFWVLKDGIKIKKAIYNLIVYRNLQFAVNGEAVVEGLTDFTTNFVLTNAGGTDFASGINKTFVRKTAVNTNNTLGSGTSAKYTVLAVDLYSLSNGANLTSSGFTVGILPKSQHLVMEGIIAYDNTGITFNQDYTGYIYLTLSKRTENGTYEVEWSVYVTGILTMEYAVSDPENEPVKDGGYPFESMDEVNLISNLSSATGLGVLATENITFALTETVANNNYENRPTKTIGIKYAIVKSSDIDKTMEEEFDDASNKVTIDLDTASAETTTDITTITYPSGNASVSWPDDVLKQKLPLVPGSSVNTPAYYYVIYEISVTHLGKEMKYYVAYLTVNYSSVSANSGHTNVTLETNVEGTKLDLFYFKDTYSYTNEHGETQTLEVTYTESGLSHSITQETDGTVKYEGFECASTGKTTFYGTDNKHSMFVSGFNNIFEFKDYIESLSQPSSKVRIYKEDSDGAVEKEVYFSLIHIRDGRWGIDLSTGKKDDGTPSGAFVENELYANLEILSNGEVVTSILAYNDATVEGRKGFKLKSNQAITPVNTPVALSSIFNLTHAHDADSRKFLNEKSIIGIANSWTNASSWVESGSFDRAEVTPVATFSVSEQTYGLYKLTYSRSISPTLSNVCTLSATFYAIKADKVIVIDYASSGVGTSNYIWVEYDANATASQVSTSQLVKEFAMSGSTITQNYVDSSLLSFSETPTKAHDELQDYKDDYPTLTYLEETYTVTYGSASIQFKVRYELPPEVTPAS